MNTFSSTYWLALTRLPGFGPATLRKLWQQYQSVEQMWQLANISTTEKSSLFERAKQELEDIERQGVKVLTIESTEYPQALKGISDISPVLYAKGHIECLQQPAVSIVGSRAMTSYGKEVTTEFASELSRHNYVIVSGMARGVDTCAHKAALQSGGQTIAVWGSGLDIPYPSENTSLSEEIISKGAVISQFPLGTTAQSFTFPARNKIIAGLSLAVVVTEARAKSGSLLTAEEAQRYNKPVFAVPGSVFSVGAKGPHNLIKQGAHLAVDAADIVGKLNRVEDRVKSVTPALDLSDDEKLVVSLLQQAPMHIDEIIRLIGKPTPATTNIVITLEMRGVIHQLDGGEYRLVQA